MQRKRIYGYTDINIVDLYCMRLMFWLRDFQPVLFVKIKKIDTIYFSPLSVNTTTKMVTQKLILTSKVFLMIFFHGECRCYFHSFYGITR